MGSLITLLTTIALIDSLSVIPLCIIPLISLFGSKRPLFGSFMLILGIFLTYLLSGLLLLVGLDAIIHQLEPYVRRWWYHPNGLELVLQIAFGTVLFCIGFTLQGRRGRKKASAATFQMTPSQALLFGSGFTIAGMWGALPYFAAIDQILQEQNSRITDLLLIIYYNLVFVLLLVLLVIVGALLKEGSEALFTKINEGISQWGGVVVKLLLTLLGLALVVDGIGWFMGMPLFPV